MTTAPSVARVVLRGSVIDRLLTTPDDEADRIGPAELQRAVRRDLEWLLNSRCAAVYHELEEDGPTVLSYGLPDFAPFSATSQADLRRVARVIAAAIRGFEPRLVPATVKVQPLESPAGELTARFQIDAVLRVDPIREPVRFETVFDHEGGLLQVESR